VEENNPGREINISIKPDFPLCSLDKGMLEQIIYNLMNNAAIHTPFDARIEISATCHADVLNITIEDAGKGFVYVNPKNVFNKFSRDSNNRMAGSGLGLSIVKGFTEALSGIVELQRSHLGGARFIITIPVKTTYFQSIQA
jgi:two-component system sensor histidine kinase KdpD